MAKNKQIVDIEHGLFLLFIWGLSLVLILISIMTSEDSQKEYSVIESVTTDFGNELVFNQTDELTLFQTDVSLAKGDAFLISFDIDGQDDDGGMVYVDLYAKGYDRDDTEIRYSVANSAYSVSRKIGFGETHPAKCVLRFFSAGDTQAQISNITIERIKYERSILAFLGIALAILSSMILSIHCGESTSGKSMLLLFSGIVILQVLVMLYWANQKSNYYVDELYSMEGAQKFSAVIADRGYLYENWSDEEITVGELRAQLIIDEGESVFDQSFLSNAKQFIIGRNYFGLLNMIESIFGRGRIDAFPAIVFNTCAFVITQIILFLLLKMIHVKSRSTLIGCVWYGFCGMTVGNVEYVRFYTLATLLFIIVIYLHARMWMNGSIYDWIMGGIISCICVFLGYKNTELMLPLSISFIVFYIIGLLVRKKWISALIYGSITGIAGTIALFHTWELDRILHNEENIGYTEFFEGTGDINRIDEMVYLIHTATLGSIWKKLGQCVELISVYIFGNAVVMASIAIMIIASVGYLIIKIPHLQRTDIVSRNTQLLADGFIVIIAAVFVTYTAFNVLAMNIILRYYSFVCALVICVVVFTVDRFLGRYGKGFICGLGALIVIGCISCQQSGDIPYIYLEDREFHEAISPYSSSDSVILFDVQSFQRTVYEAVIDLNDDVTIESSLVKALDMPKDKLLLWTFPNQCISDYLLYFEEHGYQYSYLTTGSSAEVYLVEKCGP